MATTLVLTNGELLAKAREKADLDQEQLAHRIGVSRTTISRWERNLADPSARQVKAIEQETGADWLWSQLRRYVNLLDARMTCGVDR